MRIDKAHFIIYNVTMIFKNVYHKIWKIEQKHSKSSVIDFDNVISIKNLQYGKDKNNNMFDIHMPIANFENKLPTIVVIHGGGYISGKKRYLDSYCKTLASKGFCVVNMEYTKCDGFEQKYFTNQIAEVYDLFEYMYNNERVRKHIDFGNIFLAGDSAGAHIVSMVANIQTNPALKDVFNLSGRANIKGLILVSPMFGPYKIGLPVRKQYEDVVFGNIDENIKFNCYPFDILSKDFPPSIMLSFKNDFLVKKHKKDFLKLAEKLNLSVEHYDVLKGYKIFHDVITKYPDCYPKCIDKIVSFAKRVVHNTYAIGVNKHKIMEDNLKPNLKNNKLEK